MIKGRATKGNVVTKYSIKRIELKEKGVSTLKPRKIWFDEVVRRLNVDGRGELLGEFRGDDMLLIVTQKGFVKTLTPNLSTHFDEDMIVLEKWNPVKPLSAVYYEGEKERYYVKRFLVENGNREEMFISEHPKSFLELISTDWRPQIDIEFSKLKGKDAKPNQNIDLENFISIKGIKALGNQLTAEKVKNINILDPLPYEEPIRNEPNEIEVVDEEAIIAQRKSPTDTEISGNSGSAADNPENLPDRDEEGQIKLF